MTLDDIIAKAINPAAAILPMTLDKPEARVMQLAAGYQESKFLARRQMGNGPARSFWQFEMGGVAGVFKHSRTAAHCRHLAIERSCIVSVSAIYAAIEHDDVLAAGMARLLLYADAMPLPELGDADGGWRCYLRCWNPGKPRPAEWPEAYSLALAAIASEA